MLNPSHPLVAIVACTPSGVIGLNGGMPWKLGSDLRRFKTLTIGGTLVMGRKTYDSIGKPLPGRETVVLSRTPPPGDSAEHLHWGNSVDSVMQLIASLDRPAFIVGGAEIYEIFFPRCEEIWLTRVWSNVQGDTRIDLPLEEFSVFEQSRHAQTDRDSVPTEFQKWRRKNFVPKIQLSPLS